MVLHEKFDIGVFSQAHLLDAGTNSVVVPTYEIIDKSGISLVLGGVIN